MRDEHAAALGVLSYAGGTGLVRQPALDGIIAKAIARHQRRGVRGFEVDVGAARFDVDVRFRFEVDMNFGQTRASSCFFAFFGFFAARQSNGKL